MRTDIGIHINGGNFRWKKTEPTELYGFRWTGERQGLALVAEITVPLGSTIESLRQNCYVRIPYTPEYHVVVVRFKEDIEGGNYIANAGGQRSFKLFFTGDDGTYSDVMASQLVHVSSDFVYRIMPDYTGNRATICDGMTIDLDVVDANTQNTNMMLVCKASNNYRYPTMGVGLQNWINSTNINATLIDTLKREFANDGTPVVNARYDFETQKLNLQLNYDQV